MYKKIVIFSLFAGCLAGLIFATGTESTASAGFQGSDSQPVHPGLNTSSKHTSFLPIVIEGIERTIYLRFAVIGDYGTGNQKEADVAALIKSWNPDFIITTGDNNYPDGAASTIDENIGQFFHEFIAPYKGSYGESGQENRFFPSLGNHDWHATDVQPYLDYFTLPGNERYYDFYWGAAHFFVLDSDSDEPDGSDSSSVQAAWLQSQLAASNSPWKIVYFHHSPYSSGMHGPIERMQWPFAQWGADVVISGHDHTYERISKDGIYYFVNGLGGAGIYDFNGIIDGSQVRYNEDYGAMLVEVGREVMRFKFINRQGVVIDDFELHQSATISNPQVSQADP
ncbi:MAG: metallophosphoesterase [Chloroflexota bacterium]|nr:MAG: metallophosphoesterase [Chloroflexota bacterium]